MKKKLIVAIALLTMAGTGRVFAQETYSGNMSVTLTMSSSLEVLSDQALNFGTLNVASGVTTVDPADPEAGHLVVTAPAVQTSRSQFLRRPHCAPPA